MSFFEAEASKFLSRPVELYHFSSNDKDYYFTNSDQTIIFNDISWKPETLRRSKIVNSNDLKRSEINVFISQENDLKEYCFSDRINKGLQLTIYSYQIAEQEATVTFSGTLLQQDIRSEVEIELVFAQIGQFVLNRSQRYRYHYKCNHDQYSKACGLSLKLNSDEVKVLEINNNGKEIVFSNTGKAINYYQQGICQLVKNFEKEEIYIEKDEVGTNRTITLEFSFNNLEVGDTINVAFGCKNTSSNCKSVNNFDNFLGFEYIPDENYFTDGITDAGQGNSGVPALFK